MHPRISKSAVVVLNIAGVYSLEDCAAWSAAELAALRGFGPKAIRLLEPALAEKELAFREP